FVPPKDPERIEALAATFDGPTLATSSNKARQARLEQNTAKLKALLAEIENKVSGYLKELDDGDAQEEGGGADSGRQRLSAEELKQKIAQLKARKKELQSLAKELEKALA